MGIFELFGVKSKTDTEIISDFIGPDGVSTSMRSAGAGNVGDLKILYENGARFNNQDKDGWTPLFYAVASHKIDAVRYLLSVGVDLNKRAHDGWTALMVALDHNQRDIVGLLLDAGAKIGNFGTVGQVDVCELVIACKHPDLVAVLLEHGADANLPHPVNGAPPAFFWGIFKGDPSGVDILYRYGANFNIKDKISGQTPIMVAVGNVDIVKAFLRCGADPTSRDNDGESAYEYAKNPAADPRVAAVLPPWR